jgi:hypothetical protein
VKAFKADGGSSTHTRLEHVRIHLTATAQLIPKRLAAVLRDMPSFDGSDDAGTGRGPWDMASWHGGWSSAEDAQGKDDLAGGEHQHHAIRTGPISNRLLVS